MSNPLNAVVKAADRALQTVGRATRAAGMRFAGATENAWSILLTWGKFDYKSRVGDGSGNSAVMAVVLWVARQFPEAPLRVAKLAGDGSSDVVPGHAMAKLIERPNGYYSGALLWMATIADFLLTGNAYWMKIRSNAGRVVELWYVPSRFMEPKWDKEGETFITHYEYKFNATKPAQIVAPADVVHFRYGIDPSNTRKGLSPLGSVMREVYTDDEAADFTASLLRNMGVPGVIISPDEANELTQDGADTIKAQFRQKFTGDKRGEPMLLSGKVKVTPLSFNPQQMDLKAMRRVPEERVSAIMGLPAIVAGLGAGLDRSTFANYAEAREAAYESNIIPTQRLLAEEVDLQLLPDFEANTDAFMVLFDNSNVRVLQPDEDAIQKRVRANYSAGILSHHEARGLMGVAEPSTPDFYLIPSSGAVTPLDELAQPTPTPVVTVLPAMPQAQLPATGGMGDQGTTPTGTGGTDTPPTEPPPATDNTPPAKGAPVATKDAAADSAAQDVADAITEAIDGQRDATGKDVARFLKAQGRRVAAKARASKAAKVAADAVFDVADEERRMRQLLERQYKNVIADVAKVAGDRLNSAVDITDTVRRAYLRDAGENIRDITDHTMRTVRAVLQQANEDGATLDETADRLQQSTAFGEARALTVARTELRQAQNRASTVAYRASGVVVGVLVFDGDQDPACAEWSGKVVPIDDAHTIPPLGHPNCVRALGPMVGGD